MNVTSVCMLRNFSVLSLGVNFIHVGNCWNFPFTFE